ncbi:uncharacterized protein F5147DRAFT_668811 [Suillus discolor]|uniref:BAG domain-containing protein n=1 Tax=Suillus discolor TaxID=1912936 RepID=A0A9P7JZ98_9AGAM|nr:uncharacterized protein F5147DRAFT_668811 [Suillus discolor]KAG2117828.1 hypothetical protein F5147DRAFT_668811 [Suillus discolor]
MLVFATPYRSVDPYAARQRAWARHQQQLRNQSIQNALYAQQYPNQQSIHQLRSINGLLNRVLERDDYLHTPEPYYGYSTNDLAEFEYELALSRAARNAAIQQLHRDHNPAIRGWCAAPQAQRKKQERERELHARRRATEANGFLAHAEPYLSAYWPCGLPVDAELPTQATASTSKAPVQNQPCLQERLDDRMSQLQSIFDSLSGGTSTEAPVQCVPVTSTTPTSTQVNVNGEPTTSSYEGKGKAKEIRDSDESLKDRLEDRLMDQFQSELSNTFRSILTSLSEGTSTDTPRVPVTFAAPTSTQVNVDEERTTSSHKGKGKAKETPDSDTEEESSASPAQVASSLSQITWILSRLETLLADFQFPAELDFSPSRSPSPGYSALDTDDTFALTYTATNAPLRAQEHALSLLLGDLDNIPSFGSHAVRDARRAVVARVEQALEELEKGVEERRGRARARKADSVIVTVPVEQASEPENLTSADLAPIKVPVIDEAPTNVFVPALQVEAIAAAAPSPIEAIVDPVVLDAIIEAPTGSIGIATASVAEPSSTSASLPTASSEEPLTAQQVSVPQEEESEEPLVDAVGTAAVSEDPASEDAVIIEATDLPANADLIQPSSLSATRLTPPPLDTSDSHSQNTLGVSHADFENLTHADGDIPAEVVDTTDEPASLVPAAAAAASSFLGSDHEQTPSEVNVIESYSSVELAAPSSPVSETEVDTFLLL